MERWVLMVWAAIVVASAVFWVYAVIGFWVINGAWIKAAWRVVAG